MIQKLKNLTKFQKQIIAMAVIAVVIVACFVVWAINKPQDKPVDEGAAEKPITFTYGFNETETEKIKAFTGKATFTFAAEKGKAGDLVAPLMALADDYSKLNPNIKVNFGQGKEDCRLTVDGVTTSVDINAEGLYAFLEGTETPYKFSVRKLFNTAFFGDPLGATWDAIKGYDLDGDVINAGGNIEFYNLGTKTDDLEFVRLQNEHGETTFYITDGIITINDFDSMGYDSVTVMSLVAFARAPIAVGKVAQPKEPAAYGINGLEGSVASMMVGGKNGEVHTIYIGDVVPNGTGRYMMYEGKKHIYMSNTYTELALNKAEDFLTAVYGQSIANGSIVYDAIDDIIIDFGDDRVVLKQLTDEETKLYTLNYSWKMTEPKRFVDEEVGYALANFANVGDLFYAASTTSSTGGTGLSTLESGEIVAGKATDEAIKEYGLDKPYRTFSWVTNGTVRCTVYFSQPDGSGNMYVYGTKETVKKAEDGSYTVEAKAELGIGKVNLSAYPSVALEPIQYRNDTLYAEFASTVSSMTFEKDGETHKISYFLNSEGKLDSAKLDGKATDLLTTKFVYEDIISCHILGEYRDAVPEKPDLKITLVKNGKETVLEFARVTTVKVHCAINGKGGYYISYDDLEELLTSYGKLLKGETIGK